MLQELTAGLQSLGEQLRARTRGARSFVRRFQRLRSEQVRAAPTMEPVLFGYAKPPARSQGKEVVRLCQTTSIRASVQVLRKGSEENPHSHEGVDGFWWVVRGRARFYGEEDVLLAELGPHEGILIPRSTRYWFESAGSQDLELLQVLGYDRRGPVDRFDHAPRNFDRSMIQVFDGKIQREQDW